MPKKLSPQLTESLYAENIKTRTYEIAGLHVTCRLPRGEGHKIMVEIAPEGKTREAALIKNYIVTDILRNYRGKLSNVVGDPFAVVFEADMPASRHFQQENDVSYENVNAMLKELDMTLSQPLSGAVLSRKLDGLKGQSRRYVGAGY